MIFYEKPGKILQWLNAKGYAGTLADAFTKYVQDGSPLTNASFEDHLIARLNASGYSGTLSDMLTTMFQEVTGLTNRDDAEHKFFDDATKDMFIPYQGSLTFFKNSNKITSTLNADYSIGPAAATFTATRSASAPATYIDSSGVIQLTTTSDVGRYQGGYYDTNGFTRQAGLMIEAAGTNLLTRTDGTAGTTLWTGWTDFSSTSGNVNSLVDIPELTSIPGAKSQRWQYDGVTSNTGTNVDIRSPLTAVGSVAQNDVVTFSMWVRSQTIASTGLTSLKLQILARDSGGLAISTYSSAFDLRSIGNTWIRVTHTATITDATVSRVYCVVSGTGVDTGDTVDIEFYGAQFEVYPYATSFIPTTTASLTRGAEVLKYETSGNRTAASETIFIKFAPNSTWDTTQAQRLLIDSDIARRTMLKPSLGTIVIQSLPNLTVDPSVKIDSTSTPTANTSMVSAAVFKHSSPYISVYTNGSSEGTYTAGDFTNPAWGTYFFIGSNNSGALQINGIIQSVAIYNRALSDSEVLSVSNYLNTI